MQKIFKKAKKARNLKQNLAKKGFLSLHENTGQVFVSVKFCCKFLAFSPFYFFLPLKMLQMLKCIFQPAFGCAAPKRWMKYTTLVYVEIQERYLKSLKKL